MSDQAKLARLDNALGEPVIEPKSADECLPHRYVQGQGLGHRCGLCGAGPDNDIHLHPTFTPFGSRRQPIATAPKDGTEITVPVQWNLQAFWCDDLKRWVLSRPLEVDSIHPEYWIPK
jgi:hypothetical protein